MSSELIRVLMVEDDEGDLELVRKSLESLKSQIELAHVSDGQECLNYLMKTGEYVGAVRPDLVLLDLNMPKLDGREILKEMRSHHDLKCIPVIVLTTSDSQSDIDNAYALGANCYVAKPVDFNQFQELFDKIASFWFTVVRLPGGK